MNESLTKDRTELKAEVDSFSTAARYLGTDRHCLRQLLKIDLLEIELFSVL